MAQRCQKQPICVSAPAQPCPAPSFPGLPLPAPTPTPSPPAVLHLPPSHRAPLPKSPPGQPGLAGLGGNWDGEWGVLPAHAPLGLFCDLKAVGVCKYKPQEYVGDFNFKSWAASYGF